MSHIWHFNPWEHQRDQCLQHLTLNTNGAHVQENHMVVGNDDCTRKGLACTHSPWDPVQKQQFEKCPERELFANLKVSAGEVGACCDSLWGKRCWWEPLLHSPSTLLMLQLAMPILHSPYNLLASEGMPHSPHHSHSPIQCPPGDCFLPLPIP